MYVERRVAGKWEILAPPPPPPASERTQKRMRDGEEFEYVSPFWGPHACMYWPDYYDRPHDEEGGPELHEMYKRRWYHNRNYEVFAILTGTVRNTYGFNSIVPRPRGLRRSMQQRYAHASWDHSEGWLRLDEILAFNWDQESAMSGLILLAVPPSKRGFLDREDYLMWRSSDPRVEPASYCQGASGRVLTEEHAEELLRTSENLSMAADAQQAGKLDLVEKCLARDLSIDSRISNTYVRVCWQQSYRKAAADFLAFVDQMLIPLGDPGDTRLVFGFDS